MVFYFLMGRNTQQGFGIDKRTGVISVHRALDREFQNRFVLTVLAKNRGSIVGNDTDEAQVIIRCRTATVFSGGPETRPGAFLPAPVVRVEDSAASRTGPRSVSHTSQ